MSREGGVYVIGKAEIDTRRPFRSVKEAVLLFGETVLVGGIYADKRNKMKTEARKSEENAVSSLGSTQSELEGTKQMIENARKEGMLMVTALTELKEELQNTRKELERLQPMKSANEMKKTELVDMESTENSSGVKEGRAETERRRHVRFAKPHIAEVIVAETPNVIERKFSATEANPSEATKRNKKTKALFPALGIIFSSKKDHPEHAKGSYRGK